MSRLVFASLFTIDPRSLEVVGDLAESFEVIDPMQYRVRLRDGLRFSDGSALDATDVVDTYLGILDPRLESRYAGTYARIREVRAEDAHTVTFTLDAPHATFLTDLEMPIVRSEDATRRLEESFVGAGPYRIVSRGEGRTAMAPNPHWHGGVPLHRDLRFVVVRDDNTRALRLLAGAGDAAINSIPPLLIPLFENDDRFEVRSAPGVSTTYLGFHTDVIPAQVREAIALAIDRESLIVAKLNGRAHIAESWIPEGHWAAIDLPERPLDRERSAALLDEAGWTRGEDGVRRRLILRVGADRFRVSVSRAIAAMLAEVGLDVVVRPSESATLIADLNAGRFELCFLQVPEVFEPHVLSWFFASEHVPEGQQLGANRWRLRDSILDDALERGRANPDLDVRRDAYAIAQRRLYDTFPVFPLWQEDTVVVARRGLTLDVPRDGRFATLAR